MKMKCKCQEQECKYEEINRGVISNGVFNLG